MSTALWIFTDNAANAPFNITERSTAPTNPATNDIYLDDGTNTGSGNPGWRRYTGSAWEDVSAGTGSGDTLPIVDTTAVVKGSVDATKLVRIEADGLTTATTRVITMPDANVDLAHVNDLPVANLADGTDGELITWSAAGAPTTVAVGTSGQVLTSNGAGAAPTFQDAGGAAPTIYEGTYTVGGSAIDTTSSTYSDVDATNIKETVSITTGQTVIAWFFISNVLQVTGGTGTFRLVAGSTAGDNANEPTNTLTSASKGLLLMDVWAGLTTASYDFKPQFKTSANTCRVSALTTVTWRVEVFG